MHAHTHIQSHAQEGIGLTAKTVAEYQGRGDRFWKACVRVHPCVCACV